MRKIAQIFQSARYAAVAAAILILFWLTGPRIAINTSASLPIGFYLVKNYDGGAVEKGDIVLFYDKNINSFAYKRGYITEGEPIGKRVAAVEGDMINIDSEKIAVHGKTISAKAPPKDSKGRMMELFHYRGTVPQGSLFLIGDDEKSFDSRYYGFIKKNHITSIITPFIVW